MTRLNWIKKHNLGIFIGCLMLSLVGILISTSQITQTYLLVNPTGEQIQAFYKDKLPCDEFNLQYVSSGSSLVEMRTTTKWYKDTEMREYLESNGYEFIKQ